MEPGSSTAERNSRAGRNLPAAIATGVGLLLLCLVTLFTYKWTFGVVVSIAMVIATWEFSNAFKQYGIQLTRIPVVLAAAVMPLAAFWYGVTGQLVVMGIAVLIVIFWRIPAGTIGYVKDVTSSVFVTAYLPFMASFLMLTLATDNGPTRVLVFVFLTAGNDIGGYVAGVLFGKHPIAPSISPKKSWEGLAGSLVLQTALGIGCFVFLLDAPAWQGAVAGIILCFTATAGDFAESAVKRDLGIKDMGKLLPGHGGVMDRLDSLIPNAFTSWALFTMFLGSA
ncbi:MAG TPA: phosphatidate cytidylyltransferase [Actinobacteria bacterium]|nr:phosphatidate cytidylyltransferase [Actinomycetota bacterium]